MARAVVAALDTAYQAAVKANDAATMDRILHKDFVLVLGDGRLETRTQLIDDARAGIFVWERQDEEAGTQTVRVFGDTAIVTAKLWIKGTKRGVAFDRTLWFSDTYVRTKHGWKYAFGQASLPLPAARVTQVVEDGEGERFDPGHGRVQKEWLSVSGDDPETWRELAREAESYVARRSR